MAKTQLFTISDVLDPFAVTDEPAELADGKADDQGVPDADDAKTGIGAWRLAEVERAPHDRHALGLQGGHIPGSPHERGLGQAALSCGIVRIVGISGRRRGRDGLGLGGGITMLRRDVGC